MPIDFPVLCGEHILWLCLLLALGWLFVSPLGRQASARTRWVSARLLALILVGLDVIWFVWQAVRGTWNLEESLPLHACDLAIYVAAVALLTQRPMAFAITWFWGLTTCLHAVLTPELMESWPSLYAAHYWLTHGLVIVAGFVLYGVHGLRTSWRQMWQVLGLTLVVFGLIAPLNLALGTNYWFLRAKPIGENIIQQMPEWPLYLPILIFVGVLHYVAIQALVSWHGRLHAAPSPAPLADAQPKPVV